MSRNAKNLFAGLGAYCRHIRPIPIILRSWFAGGCIGVVLTLALLNPLMCVLHCALLDHAGSAAELHEQALHCALLHHHELPAVAVDAIPDNLPILGITLNLPRAFYEMSMTVVVISVLLILIHTSAQLPSTLPKFLGPAPLIPPPKP